MKVNFGRGFGCQMVRRQFHRSTNFSGKSVQKDREKEVAECLCGLIAKAVTVADLNVRNKKGCLPAMFSFLLLLTRISVAVILQ